MKKTYELDDYSQKNKRIFQDFNLYGCNLNIPFKEEIDDLIKYGRTK